MVAKRKGFIGKSASTNKVLDIKGGKVVDDQPVQHYKANGTINQIWIVRIA